MENHPENKGRPHFSPELLDLLANGEMDDCRLAPEGSNYAFFATLSGGGHTCPVVYKPQRGEAPLWDFPDGTLYRREYAAYLLSEVLGWCFVPPTVVREGVHGVGSVQLFMESQPNAHYFTLKDDYRDEMLRTCAFDVIVNNADRKASHCLLGTDGWIWLIDHGVTFHDQYKLRTVVWNFAGEPVDGWLINDLERLLDSMDRPEGLIEQINSLLSPQEAKALQCRVADLLERRVFPMPGSRRSVPWPMF